MPDTAHFFEAIFSNTQTNGIIIYNEEGIIQKVNEAFTLAYGYKEKDLVGHHFRIIFPDKDQKARKPEIELNTVLREGSANDENYLVNKEGVPIWVTGESILVKTEGETCIVKIIHNIHAQKQLERYLLDSSELLENLFDSVQEVGLLLVDSRLKTMKANKAFKLIFHLTDPITEGLRINNLNHPFWIEDEIKNDVLKALVGGTPIEKEYVISNGGKEFQKIHIQSKLIFSEQANEKRLLMIIRNERAK